MALDEVIELAFYVTSGNPGIYFALAAECSSWGDAQAFALLNEGYCDTYESGGVTLEFVDATIAPIEWLEAPLAPSGGSARVRAGRRPRIRVTPEVGG